MFEGTPEIIVGQINVGKISLLLLKNYSMANWSTTKGEF